MRGFYETEKKTKPLTRAEDIRRRALARQKAEDPRNWPKSPTDIGEHKVLAGLRDAVEKRVAGTKVSKKRSRK